MDIKVEDLYDLIYNWKNYQKEADEIKDMIKSKKHDAMTVLDVACGTGRHMEYLNNYYTIDGIDISERFIEIAKERNPDSNLWCKDMTTFEIEQQYDVVMCLFSAIAYVKTYKDLVHTLKQMKKHTKPKGLIIVEPWFAPDTFYDGNISVTTGENDEMKVSRMYLSEKKGNVSILHFEYLVGTKKRIMHLSEMHELGLFTENEMLSAFKEAGLDTEYDPQGITGRGMYISKCI
ncbi:class I SAM-dependent methyltransferase [Neobacillus sp. NRS-1170]|uniref:class I SAM-dependent methyltransferase n=1 Tax=Neobacillus sp. NRS-1170 TaxID=3233898 RepID=UPI003D29FAE2